MIAVALSSRDKLLCSTTGEHLFAEQREHSVSTTRKRTPSLPT